MTQRWWRTTAAGIAAATVPVLALAARQSLPNVSAIADSFKPFAPRVRTHADAGNFYVESDGMPDHPLMVGITAWQQQVPLPQPYVGRNAWQFPLHPVPAAQPLSAKTHFFRGAIAIAADGVPIFNALNNRGEDSYLAGELDTFGGHSGRADDYHYHVAPLYLEKIMGKGKPIAYALDGYPLYGLNEPGGSAPGKLDAFNGHTTARLGYHYHASLNYPYINGGFHGAVTEVGGQADPQPRAQPVRPDTLPLRGARITGWARPRPDSYELTYTLGSETRHIRYSTGSDGVYNFDYVDGQGVHYPRTYSRRQPPQGPERQGPGEQQGGRGRQGDRPPAPPAPPEIVTPAPTDFQLTSGAVTSGGSLPVAYTCDGESVSPPVSWKNVPAGTKAFALVMHHIPPGAEAPHVYWIVYGLPATVKSLARNDHALGTHGINTINGRSEYAPPCSKGPGKKWYVLTLYALSADPKLAPNAPITCDSLLKAMEGRILKTAVLNVSYERPER